jgi:hypothetical protein
MMLKCKKREASLVTVAAENAGLSERKSGCRRMQGRVHFSKASRDAAANRPFIAALVISKAFRGLGSSIAPDASAGLQAIWTVRTRGRFTPLS